MRKTVLVDFNNVVVKICQSKGVLTKLSIGDNSLAAQVILENIRNFVSNQCPETDEVILCIDSKSWRKRLPFKYKENREKKQKDDESYKMIFNFLNQFVKDIQEAYVLSTMKVNLSEADDIIAVLAKYITSKGENVVIFSGDIDFAMLHNGSSICTYRNGWVRFPLEYKSEGIHFQSQEHMINYFRLRGQTKDNVPKIDEDEIITGSRKRTFGPKAVLKILENPEEVERIKKEFPKNWKRNDLLLNFDRIPQTLQSAIINIYEARPGTNSSNFGQLFDIYNLHNFKTTHLQIYESVFK